MMRLVQKSRRRLVPVWGPRRRGGYLGCGPASHGMGSCGTTASLAVARSMLMVPSKNPRLSG